MNESLAFAHIVLGLGLAWVIPFSSQQFWLEQSSVHHPTLVVRYAWRLAVDIARSNVCRGDSHSARRQRITASVYRLPTDCSTRLCHYHFGQYDFPYPGTVSAHISKDKKHLLIHVLHLEDEKQLRNDIFERYEQPLKEIFEC